MSSVVFELVLSTHGRGVHGEGSPVRNGMRRCVAPAWRVVVTGWCVLALLGGCRRPSGLDVHPVSGTVTLDGASLEEGLITFRATDGDTRAFAGRVVRGKYTVEAFSGTMTVSITAHREVPGKFTQAAPDEPQVPVLEQFIPDRYNDRSELQVDVPKGGTRQLDFTLTAGGEGT